MMVIVVVECLGINNDHHLIIADTGFDNNSIDA
jgi:hypothetical protein